MEWCAGGMICEWCAGKMKCGVVRGWDDTRVL